MLKRCYIVCGFNKKRNLFFEEINKLEEKEFFEKWFPDSLKVKLERALRKIMAKTGIYKIVKRNVKKILNKN